eukprot:6492527-Amphidinium_carterae.1
MGSSEPRTCRQCRSLCTDRPYNGVPLRPWFWQAQHATLGCLEGGSCGPSVKAARGAGAHPSASAAMRWPESRVHL